MKYEKNFSEDKKQNVTPSKSPKKTIDELTALLDDIAAESIVGKLEGMTTPEKHAFIMERAGALRKMIEDTEAEEAEERAEAEVDAAKKAVAAAKEELAELERMRAEVDKMADKGKTEAKDIKSLKEELDKVGARAAEDKAKAEDAARTAAGVEKMSAGGRKKRKSKKRKSKKRKSKKRKPKKRRTKRRTKRR